MIIWWYVIKRLVRKLFRIKPKAISLADWKTPDRGSEYTRCIVQLLFDTEAVIPVPGS